MTSWPRVQFVDSPSVSATVRYDFNDDTVAAAPRWVANEGGDFTLGVPTLSGSPDSVGQSYGFRSPSFKQRVKGSKAAALSALSALSRELLRPTNWLLFQLDASTAPVWLRIYRSGFEPLSLNRVTVNRETGGLGAGMDAWEIAVPLVADAFAYGARVTIPTAQVIQGPAALTGPTRTPMRMVLPAIKGDAPTALRVAVTPANTQYPSPYYPGWLVGCINGVSGLSDPVFNIGTSDGFSPFNGTAGPTTDATYFGGDYRPVTVAAGSGLLTRLTGTFAALPLGRYKVLLRMEVVYPGSDVTVVHQLNTYPITAGVPAPLPSVSIKTSSVNSLYWVDLGEVGAPMGDRPPTDTGITTADVIWGLKLGTADGSAITLRLDSFKLIPVDGPSATNARLLWSRADMQPAGGTQQLVWDGDTEKNWTVSTSGGALAAPATTVAQGGFPVADPASPVNLLVVVATNKGLISSAASSTMTLNAQAAVDVSYYPRYLHIGDGT